MREIQFRNDIIELIDLFYSKVVADPIIGTIFTQVAKVNFETHLPVMYSFWASQLLGEQSYSGNPMIPHIRLSKVTPLDEIQFNEWLRLFKESVDQLFVGEKAEEAKYKAGNIARLMHYKINLELK